jgi:hypothetical protein
VPIIPLISGKNLSDQRLSVFQLFITRLLPPHVKAFYLSTVENIYSSTASNAPHNIVKLFWLLAVTPSRGFKASWKRLGVNKLWRPLAAIQSKFAVVLGQTNGLKAPWFVPNKGADVFKPPALT